MMSTANDSFREPVATESIGRVFNQHREELEWLANFLTGDELIAAACVIDASALAESEILAFKSGFRNGPAWLPSVPRYKSSNEGSLNLPPHTSSGHACTEGTRHYLPIGGKFWWRNQTYLSPDSMSSVVLPS